MVIGDVSEREGGTSAIRSTADDARAWGDSLLPRAAAVADPHSPGPGWRKARKAAGLDGYTLHDLRHSYAGGLIASGCDVVTVQRALGHSPATIVRGVHSHLWPTAEDRTRAAAGDLMAAALGARADRPRTEAL